MRFLMISNEYPFPARNGVTVPAAGYAHGLAKRGHLVDFLLLERPGLFPGDHEANSLQFRSIDSAPIQRASVLTAIWNQLIGACPYFAAWNLQTNKGGNTDYDVIWVTPRAILPAALAWREKHQHGRGLLIAAVNDIATLRLRRMASGNTPFQSFGRWVSLSFNATLLQRSECWLLNRADRIVVQTTEEVEWIKLHAPYLVDRTIVLSNGVDDVYFKVPLQRLAPRVLFVGALTGMYAERVGWFLRSVWPSLKAQNPSIELRIVGKCHDQILIEQIFSAGGTYESFVEDPTDLYRDAAILVAPIFKGYGLINKVIQAMAAGTLVVGDVTAFNGIPEFVGGRHALIAQTAKEFWEQIILALQSPDILESIRRAAREHVAKHFSWKERVDVVSALEIEQ